MTSELEIGEGCRDLGQTEKVQSEGTGNENSLGVL